MRAFKLIDMNVIKYPTTEELPSLLKRPVRDAADLNQIVAAVLTNVKAHGDQAVFDYEEQFDHVKLDNLAVSEAEIEEGFGPERELLAPGAYEELYLHFRLYAFVEDVIDGIENGHVYVEVAV